MDYTGPSVVDYLSSTGKDSSFAARKLLAEQMGVQNYTGTGSQNTQLLTSLRHLLTKPETAPPERSLETAMGAAPNESRLLSVPNTNTPFPTQPAPTQIPSTPQSTTPPKPADLFNKTLEDMLKAAQSAGNEDLMTKRNAIIQARFNAGRNATPEELRVLSPQAQASLRNLDQSGLEDQLTGVNTAIQGRETKLKNEQATRQNVLDVLLKKQQLDQTQDKQGGPIEVSPGASLYDPTTGKFIGTAPVNDKEKDLPASIREYEFAKSQGYTGSYYDFKNPSGSVTGKPPTEAEKRAFTFYSRAADAKNTLDGLDDYIAGLDLAGQTWLKVAPNFLKSTEGQQYDQARRQFAESYLRKDSGAVISPSEYASADKIYFVQPGDTKETILRKKLAREKIIGGLKNEAGKAYMDSYGERDNEDPMGLGFNTPLSMGKNGLNTGFKAGTDVAKIASAIGQFESGGRYSAVGPDTGNGNKALGKYQVMASNVPSWTKEALGQSLTPQQFLNSPEAQDAVAHYKMDQYYKKYGTVEDVASVWFSGKPVSKAGNAKDVIGTSVPKYISNVRAIYDRLG